MTHRSSYRRRGTGWEGVVKDEAGVIIAACGHIHRNRDTGSTTWGPPARTCARDLLLSIDEESFWATTPSWQRRPDSA